MIAALLCQFSLAKWSENVKPTSCHFLTLMCFHICRYYHSSLTSRFKIQLLPLHLESGSRILVIATFLPLSGSFQLFITAIFYFSGNPALTFMVNFHLQRDSRLVDIAAFLLPSNSFLCLLQIFACQFHSRLPLFSFSTL